VDAVSRAESCADAEELVAALSPVSDVVDADSFASDDEAELELVASLPTMAALSLPVSSVDDAELADSEPSMPVNVEPVLDVSLAANDPSSTSPSEVDAVVVVVQSSQLS